MIQKKEQAEIAEWLVKTCLLFGTSPMTAYKVTGLFLEALQENKEEEDGKDADQRAARQASKDVRGALY